MLNAYPFIPNIIVDSTQNYFIDFPRENSSGETLKNRTTPISLDLHDTMLENEEQKN